MVPIVIQVVSHKKTTMPRTTQTLVRILGTDGASVKIACPKDNADMTTARADIEVKDPKKPVDIPFASGSGHCLVVAIPVTKPNRAAPRRFMTANGSGSKSWIGAAKSVGQGR